MYDIFGEFDSAEEINGTAEGMKKEGDIENIKKLAAENGLEDMAEAYATGEVEELADTFSAAMGKLAVEKKEYKNTNMPVEPIIDYLIARALEKEKVARAIRGKGKTLRGCIEHTEKLAKEEVKKTGKNYVADMTVFQWAEKYYMEDGK